MRRLVPAFALSLLACGGSSEVGSRTGDTLGGSGNAGSAGSQAGASGAAGLGGSLGGGGSGGAGGSTATTCDLSSSLTSAPTTSLSKDLTVPAAGISWCLHLDGSGTNAVHFVASTAKEAGAKSSYALTLLDASGAVLQKGWDVSVGGADPTTFANLELSPKPKEILDVVLRVEPTAASSTSVTTVTLWLGDPLE